MKVLPLTPASLVEAAEHLRKGEVVAYPTETVYGLAVDPLSEGALERLFEVKGREERQAVLLLVADETQMDLLVESISPEARACMERFWPGPLSLLFPARPGLSPALLGPQGKVCLRCSAHPGARELCRIFGMPITSTSANRSGEPPARSVEELKLPGVSLALDGGPLQPSSPSTVFDPELGNILRDGSISRDMLKPFMTQA